MFVVLIPNLDLGKIVIIFDVHNTSSTHADNRKKDISVLGEDPMQRLDVTTKTANTKCSFGFTDSKKCFV